MLQNTPITVGGFNTLRIVSNGSNHRFFLNGVLVCSVVGDKDVETMLDLFSTRSSHLVATASGNPRALPAEELAARGAAYFSKVEVVPEPRLALQRAREVAGPGGAVLAAGSLYLLASLAAVRSGYVPWDTLATG